MRKIALLITGLFIGLIAANAQYTNLLYEDFNDTADLSGYFGHTIYDFPPGVANDTMWYNYDEDANPDASGNALPDGWFLSLGGGFAPVDTLDFCLMANSWTSPATASANWVFLPAIQITNGATAWLKWKSAPTQTPYYLDGYEVRISTTTNDYQTAYTDLVYTAAEYTAGANTNGNNYAAYTFSAPGFVHGADGLWTECSTCLTTVDSSRQNGIQRPDSVSLAAYDNMVIYIAFKHTSTDDFLISLDDIVVTEIVDPTFSIENIGNLEGQVYPNPATDFVNVKFDVEKYHNANIQMINGNGQVVYTTPLVTMNHRIDLTNIAAGVYFVKITADEGNMIKKLIVNK